jgi:hypothetical protein
LFQYGIWQNELKQNIEAEVIGTLSVLDKPLKQFAGIVERASKDLKEKLDAYNKEITENHSKRIVKEGFLSTLWDESEMNESDIKIRMLKEDNEDLSRELKVKSRSLRDAQEQVDRLRREKTEWQELYLNGAPVKRSADSDHPSREKRSRMEERRNPERQSSSGGRATNNRREGSRWDLKRDQPEVEIPTYRKMSEVVVDLWKQQLRKLNRYIPDKPQSGPGVEYPYGFNHVTNISFLLTAATNFKRVTEGMTSWEARTRFEHPGYEQAIKKNYIPLYKATYQEIVNNPEMALTHRCGPLSHYYIAIVQDSPGYKARSSSSGETVSNKRDPTLSPPRSPQAISRNSRTISSGNHLQDGQEITEEKHQHRSAFSNIKFPFPDDLTEGEKVEIQNLTSDINMIEDGKLTESYITWRKAEMAKANTWWEDGTERPFWHQRLKEPVDLNDEGVKQRFDIAHLANCETRISRIRLTAYGRHPFQRDGPSGQENR